MSEKNDGGPAFPVPVTSDHYAGMSLRDYFAAQALGRYTPEYCDANELTMLDVADRCYEYADAMIAERDL